LDVWSTSNSDCVCSILWWRLLYIICWCLDCRSLLHFVSSIFTLFCFFADLLALFQFSIKILGFGKIHTANLQDSVGESEELDCKIPLPPPYPHFFKIFNVYFLIHYFYLQQYKFVCTIFNFLHPCQNPMQFWLNLSSRATLKNWFEPVLFYNWVWLT
jgi:hypothetical protein